MADVAPAMPAGAAAPGMPRPAAAGPGAKAPTLWVGDLHPSVTEADLENAFKTVAHVTSVRRPRDSTTREPLSYAYVNFQTVADAEKAMQEFNYTIMKDRPMRIMMSQRDPTVRRLNVGNLFIKNLPSHVDSKTLHECFKDFGTILSCKVAADAQGVSKGYGFVHFESEEAAQLAITEANGIPFPGEEGSEPGKPISIHPYVPRSQRSGPEWTNVYVKNLPKHFNKEALDELFGKYGEIVSSLLAVDGSGASRGFGFVAFKSHEAAVAATTALNGKEMEGEPATLPPVKAKKAEGEAAEGEAPAAEAPAPAAEKRPLILFVARAQTRAERDRILRETKENARRELAARFANCNLYIRNLDDSVDDAHLVSEFSKFGPIVSSRLEKGADGSSRLFGYVCFERQEDAQKAITEMHRKLVNGKPLFVTLWQPKEQRAALLAQQRATATTASGRPGVAAPAGGAFPGAAMNPFMMMGGNMYNQGARPGFNPMAFMTPQVMQSMQSIMAQYMTGRPAGAAGPATAGAAGGARGAPAPGMPAAAIPQMMAMLMGGFPGVAAQNQPRGGAGAASASGRRGAQAGANPAVPRQAGAGLGSAGGSRTRTTPRGSAPGAPRQAAGGRPTGPAGAAAPANVQYRNTVRNPGGDVSYDAAAGAQIMSAMGIAPAAPAAPAAAASSTFVQELAQFADDAKRKQHLGTRLYKLIEPTVGENTAKVTGMLLEGMDVSELLRLLESPEELTEHVQEALSVLRAHTESAGTM